MIKKIILPLLAILLLASCSNKLSVQKRKYNKGFYIAGIKGNSDKKNNEAVAHVKPSALKTKSTNALPAEPTVEKEIVLAPITANDATENIKVYNPVKKQSTSKHEAPVYASADKSLIETKTPLKKTSESKTDISKIKASKMDSGGRLVVEIILCFFWFLNLIAVYMHDKDITLNFWITLLLDLIVIGGIIFSLLVVLDVVNAG